jgi:hypothetical protein
MPRMPTIVSGVGTKKESKEERKNERMKGKVSAQWTALSGKCLNKEVVSSPVRQSQ